MLMNKYMIMILIVLSANPNRTTIESYRQSCMLKKY